MSELRVDNIVDMGGSGAPQLRKGANVTGISTITQAVVGNATINAGGINATGIVTSSSNKFVGDFASGNITAGVMTATSSVVASNITINSGGVNASGIVSATSYAGSGANLTGIALSIAPLIYNPTVGETNIAPQPTIELSVNQRIKVGVGSISLRQVSAGSTVIETFGLGISTSATYTVTVSNPGSGNKYYFDGNLSYQPTLYPGGTYTFDQSAANNSGHPLRFATAADAAGSTEYTTGVETNGTPGNSGAYTRITVAADAPTPLYYYCTNHSGMGSYVNIGKNVSISNDGTLPKLSFTPASTLSADSVIFVDIPSESITTMDGTSISATNWTFTTKPTYQLWSWGDNEKGELGQNQSAANVEYSSPVQIGSDSNWDFIAPEDGSNLWGMAIKADGSLWTWGENDNYAQLGLNDKVNRSSPTQIPGTTWTKAARGRFHGLASKTDGTLWSWGENGKGELGQNSTTDYSSPIQIGSDTTWSTDLNQISASDTVNATIKTDGTLWTWGDNESGELGLNSTVKQSSPTQIPGTTWRTVSIGNGEVASATKTDGTLWIWGKGNGGGQGDNSVTDRSSPTQLPGTTWSKSHRTFGYGIIAVKTDGTLWAWGANDAGQLGQNSVTYMSSPVQIPGTSWSTDEIKLSARYGATVFAIKTDGTAWAWGDGYYGQLGLNTNGTVGPRRRSSPTQIPGTNWASIMGGNDSAYGLRT